MFSEPQRNVVLPTILGWFLLFSVAGKAAGEPQLGRILYSYASNLRGIPVPGTETILSGDVLTTAQEGSALVELKAGTKVKIARNSFVRFLGDGESVQVELLLGAIVSESAGKPTMVVIAPKYQFAPAQDGECRYVVQLSKEQATVVGAIKGNLLVKARNASESYVLNQGKYAAIAAWAAGVPAQAVQPAGQAGARVAGKVSNIVPDDVVQRNGQGAEAALEVNDVIFWDDVVRTSQNGRLRLELLDGSSVNIGTRSTVRFLRHDPALQQTEIELTAGEMRAEVVKLIQEYSIFKVQTPTAVLGVVGTDFMVEAQVDKAEVYCTEGTVSVQNVDPDIAGRVILHAGEYTLVAAGRPPSAPTARSSTALQRIPNIAVKPVNTEPEGQTTASNVGWHIGSLSEAAMIGLIVGIAAGAGTAVALSVSGGHAAASPSAP